MEDNFYNDDLERFLQEQANNHKMFPSDNLWRNIHEELHEKENWPALTVAAVTFLAAIILVSIYFSPRADIFSITKPVAKKQAPAPSTLITSLSRNNTHYSHHNRSSNSNKKSVDEKNERALVQPEIVSSERSNTRSQIETNPLISTVLEQINLPSVTTEEMASRDERNRWNASTVGSAQTHQNDQFVAVNSFPKVSGTEVYTKNKTALPTENNNSKATKSFKRSRFNYLVYFTPSKSFRRLTEESLMIYQNVAGPVALNYVADINEVVRHAPGNGFETGVTLRYQLAKKFRITSGFQFNVRQYWMEAYLTHPEITTLALQTNAGRASMNRASNYRTTSGEEPTQISNKYYQVSVPIGFEYKVLGNKNISINVAGSVQPTYLLSSQAYLISSNFKNYMESENFARKWNLNTSIETFVSIQTGSYNWQIGPQFRYQQKPTFVKEYPIKENLLDYGVKIGVSKSIQ